MNDLSWRPPVPLDLPLSNSTTTYASHAARLQPHLCLLLVTCRSLRLSLEGTFTAACLLHRYALRVPDNEDAPVVVTSTTTSKESSLHCSPDDTNDDDPWPWRVASLIFLACKTEEEHRRLRDLINLVRMILPVVGSTHESSSSPNAITTTTTILRWQPDPPALDDAYWKDKERLVQAEQAVLRGLAFDVHVAHPHRLVVLVAQDCLADLLEEKGDTTTTAATNLVLQDWVQQAWRILNAGVWNVHALQQPTLALAVAALQEAMPSTMVVTVDWCTVTGVTAAALHTARTALRVARGKAE
jgi:hypothetical protein